MKRFFFKIDKFVEESLEELKMREQQKEEFEKSYVGQEFVEKFGLQHLNLLGNDYNPVIARRNNAKLQTSYVHGQRNALTYEAITNDRVLFDMLKKIPDDKFDATLFPEVCGMFVQKLKNKNNQQASLKDQKLIESGNFIMENGSLTNEERHFFLNRINKMIAYNNEVLTNQQGLLEFLPLAVSQAVNLGASSKEDIRGFVGQITEAKFTNDSEKRNAITGSLEQRKKTQSLGNLQKAKEGPVLVKKIGNNLSNKASSSKGYIHMIQLTVIVAFVLGIIVGIAYMIYTISG